MIENSQEEKILELREKGYGYKSIASTLGIKRESFALLNVLEIIGMDHIKEKLNMKKDAKEIKLIVPSKVLF